MELKKFTADEVDSSFCATGWSPDGSECMAVNPAPDGKGVVVSTFVLPRSVTFPLKFKINSDRGAGGFAINGEQPVGSYDFNALTGEARRDPEILSASYPNAGLQSLS